MPKIMLGNKRVNMCKVCDNFDLWEICFEESEEEIEPFTSLNRIECTDYKFSQEKYDRLQREMQEAIDKAIYKLSPRPLLKNFDIIVNLSVVYKE